VTRGFFGEYRALFEERQGQFRRSFDAELHGGRENNILVLTKESLLATFSYHEVQVNLFVFKHDDFLRHWGGPLMGHRTFLCRGSWVGSPAATCSTKFTESVPKK
jgi:hypothetical protein